MAPCPTPLPELLTQSGGQWSSHGPAPLLRQCAVHCIRSGCHLSLHRASQSTWTAVSSFNYQFLKWRGKNFMQEVKTGSWFYWLGEVLICCTPQWYSCCVRGRSAAQAKDQCAEEQAHEGLQGCVSCIVQLLSKITIGFPHTQNTKSLIRIYTSEH